MKLHEYLLWDCWIIKGTDLGMKKKKPYWKIEELGKTCRGCPWKQVKDPFKPSCLEETCLSDGLGCFPFIWDGSFSQPQGQSQRSVFTYAQKMLVGLQNHYPGFWESQHLNTWNSIFLKDNLLLTSQSGFLNSSLVDSP